MDKLKEKARLEKNKYLREWRSRNKDKVKQYQINYWNKKAKEQEQVLNDAIK